MDIAVDYAGDHLEDDLFVQASYETNEQGHAILFEIEVLRDGHVVKRHSFRPHEMHNKTAAAEVINSI